MLNSQTSTSILPHLHFGCGDVHIPGYLNVDARPTKATDLVMGLDEVESHYPNYFENIYICHVLEHFPLTSFPATLIRFKNLLRKQSSKLYISVPNFEVLSSIYLANLVPLEMIVRAIHGGQEYPENTHFISFDNSLLTSLLKEAGFEKISLYSPNEFLPYGIEDYSMYKIAGKNISLNVVAEL